MQCCFDLLRHSTWPSRHLNLQQSFIPFQLVYFKKWINKPKTLAKNITFFENVSNLLLRCDSPDSEIERLLEEWPLIPTHESKFIWRRQKQGILRIPLHNMHGNDLHLSVYLFLLYFFPFDLLLVCLFLLMFKHKREYQDAINLLCFYSFSPFFKKQKHTQSPFLNHISSETQWT